MSPIEAHAPGRAALLGEHCDWAGGASVAVPLPLGVWVTATPAEADLSVETALEGATLRGRWPVEGAVDPQGGPLRFVPAAAAALRGQGCSPRPTRLSVRSDLPAGRGFSSSAAFCVALIDALSQAWGAPRTPLARAELAYHVERELLGVACGRLDQISTALGGAGAHAAVEIHWAEGQAVAVRRRPCPAALPLLVAAFSAPRDTPGILASLNQHFFGQAPDREAVEAVRRALRCFGDQARLAAEALSLGDRVRLGDAMNRAQHSYEAELHARLPALRAPALVQTCAGLRARGALGAKFSGAGGDGSVVALFADAAGVADGCQWLRAQGLAAWDASLPAAPPEG